MCRPTFECCESRLIKPPAHVIDIGAFDMVAAMQVAMEHFDERLGMFDEVELPQSERERILGPPLTEEEEQAERVRLLASSPVDPVTGLFQIDSKRKALDWATPASAKSVAQLALQGTHNHRYGIDGYLSKLLVTTGRPPTGPERFNALLATRTFTNGADADTVRELYANTATAILGETERLVFKGLDNKGLEWDASCWHDLAGALPLCVSLKALQIATDLSAFGEAEMDVLVAQPPPIVESLHIAKRSRGTSQEPPQSWEPPHRQTRPRAAGPSGPSRFPALGWASLVDLNLEIPTLTSIGELRLPRLASLSLCCHSLAAAPALDQCPELRTLALTGCAHLTALPSLAATPRLEELRLDQLPRLEALPDSLGFCRELRLMVLEVETLPWLTYLPDLSHLPNVALSDHADDPEVPVRPMWHLDGWLQRGRRRFDLRADGPPLGSTRFAFRDNLGANGLPPWLVEMLQAGRLSSVDTLTLGGINQLPDCLAAACPALRRLNLDVMRFHSELLELPDLSALPDLVVGVAPDDWGRVDDDHVRMLEMMLQDEGNPLGAWIKHGRKAWRRKPTCRKQGKQSRARFCVVS